MQKARTNLTEFWLFAPPRRLRFSTDRSLKVYADVGQTLTPVMPSWLKWAYGFPGGLSAFQSFLKVQTMTAITASTGENSTPRADTLLSIEDVLPLVHMGQSTWLNGVKAGKFPAPVYLSPRRPVWKQSAIDSLIASL